MYYSYPLIGICSQPKPQGPFLLRAGISRKINFKNPFKETKTFIVSVKPDFFYTTTGTVEVEGKKQARIFVGLEPLTADSNTLGGLYPRTGKMIVKHEDVATGMSVKWPFYLKEECAGGAAPSEKSSAISIVSKSGKSTTKSVKSLKSITSTRSSKSGKSTRS